MFRLRQPVETSLGEPALRELVLRRRITAGHIFAADLTDQKLALNGEHLLPRRFQRPPFDPRVHADDRVRVVNIFNNIVMELFMRPVSKDR